MKAEQRRVLEHLCLLPRQWIRESLSDKHQFKGIRLYEHSAKLAKAIENLQVLSANKILKNLGRLLSNSIEGLAQRYEDLKISAQLMERLTDILYGPKAGKAGRNTQAYKEKMTGQEVKQELLQTIEQFKEQHKTRSTFIRQVVKHLEKTVANWETYLYTCYDHPQLPNDNNALEVSHSHLKAHHRRMTGKRNADKFLLRHGEQAVFCLAHQQTPMEDLIELLRRADFDQYQQDHKIEKEKSKRRGLKMKYIRNPDVLIEWALDEWANSS